MWSVDGEPNDDEDLVRNKSIVFRHPPVSVEEIQKQASTMCTGAGAGTLHRMVGGQVGA